MWPFWASVIISYSTSSAVNISCLLTAMSVDWVQNCCFSSVSMIFSISRLIKVVSSYSLWVVNTR